MLRIVLLLALASCCVTPLFANDWPGWRGPFSTGTSMVKDTPTHWSRDVGVSWRAEIEGYGISSPVVAGDRVYLTTAVSAERRHMVRLIWDALIGCMALGALPLIAFLEWRRRQTTHARVLGSVARVAAAFDFAAFSAAGLVVTASAVALALGPQVLDAALQFTRDFGVLVARGLGRHHTNLWFLDWDESTPHNIWIISSGLGLAALALLPFFSRRSRPRVAGALAVLAGAAIAIGTVPWSDAYGARYPLGPLIIGYAPAVMLATWHLLHSFMISGCQNHLPEGHKNKMRSALSLVPAFLALGLFGSPNLFPRRETVTRHLVSLDARTGSTVWQREVFTGPPEAKFASNSHATPTPVIAGATIVVAFGSGLAAFNAEGEILWTRNLPEWLEGSVYGAGSSPVVEEDVVFITNDREYDAGRKSSVSGYSLANGQEKWTVAPDFAHDGYATPGIYREGSRTLLVTLTSQTMAAYDVVDGAIAWRLKIPVSTPVPTPIIDGARLFVTGGRGDDAYTAGYRLGSKGPTLLWESRNNPADVSSPVLYKERLFTISSGGIMVCYDASSGVVVWRQRLRSGVGAFYASLVAADDKVYATRSDGTTFVVAAEDAFRLLSTSSLPEEVFASPAFGGGCLFLRTVSALYCVRGAQEN